MTASTGKDLSCDVQVSGALDRFDAVSGTVRIAERRRSDGNGATVGSALIKRLQHAGCVFAAVEAVSVA